VAEKVKTGELTEEQARKSRFRNVITRAIGLDPSAHPDTGSMQIETGDVLLLCTDGLSVPTSDSEIADILCTSSEVNEACDRLVKTALRNGGSDNITVVIAACGMPQKKAASSPPPARSEHKGRWLLPALVSLLIGIVLGLLAGQIVIPKLQDKREAVVVPVTPQPGLSGVIYEDPVALLYQPLQGLAWQRAVK
jgi:hypothetical protein